MSLERARVGGVGAVAYVGVARGLRRCGGVVNESMEDDELELSEESGRDCESSEDESGCTAVRLYRFEPVDGMGTTTGSVV